MLQKCVVGCKTRIPREVSLLCLARCCTVLRSRWCQSGVNNVLAAPVRATRSADSSENGEYSLIRSSMMPAGAFRGLRRRSHPSSWKVMCARPRAFLYLHVVPGAARARDRQAALAGSPAPRLVWRISEAQGQCVAPKQNRPSKSFVQPFTMTKRP